MTSRSIECSNYSFLFSSSTNLHASFDYEEYIDSHNSSHAFVDTIITVITCTSIAMIMLRECLEKKFLILL